MPYSVHTVYASTTQPKDHQVTWGHSLIYQQITNISSTSTEPTTFASLSGPRYHLMIKGIFSYFKGLFFEKMTQNYQWIRLTHQVLMTMWYIYADTLNKSYPYRKSCQSCLPRWDWGRWHICAISSDECMACECGDMINPWLMQLLNSAGII